MELTDLRNFFQWCLVLNAGILLLWSLVYLVAKDTIYQIHSRWFEMPKEKFEFANPDKGANNTKIHASTTSHNLRENITPMKGDNDTPNLTPHPKKDGLGVYKMILEQFLSDYLMLLVQLQ